MADLVVPLTAVATGLALVTLGGALYEFTVVDPCWPRRPDLFQPGQGALSRKRFWFPAHIAFEVLLIALLVAVRSLAAIRFWLVIAFASHAAMRMWPAADPISKALEFERAEPRAIVEPAARAWTRRSLPRLPLDLVTCSR